MNLPMTHKLRETIAQYIKNGIDISPLIKDIDIRGEDLSRAIIKTLNIPDTDISNTCFFQAIIGTEGNITNWNRIIARNCNFHRAKFLGTIWVRNADFRGSNFREADLVSLDYKFADFRNCDLCGTIIRMGSGVGMGAKVDQNFLKDLADSWNVEVKLKT